jgi:excisionase family DNA binding protein
MRSNTEAEQLRFPELVDINDAAELLSTSVRHVRRLVDRDLPSVKIGGSLRFDKADLREYIERNRRPRPPRPPITIKRRTRQRRDASPNLPLPE